MWSGLGRFVYIQPLAIPRSTVPWACLVRGSSLFVRLVVLGNPEAAVPGGFSAPARRSGRPPGPCRLWGATGPVPALLGGTRRLQIRRQQTRRCVARTLDLLLGGASGLATTRAPRWVRRAGGRHRLSSGCCVRGLSSPAPSSSGWLTVAVHVFRSCLEGKDGL